MQVDIAMKTENGLVVERWWAKTPEFVVSSLQAQLAAATAIWPDLKQYAIGKRRPKNPESTS